MKVHDKNPKLKDFLLQGELLMGHRLTRLTVPGTLRQRLDKKTKQQWNISKFCHLPVQSSERVTWRAAMRPVPLTLQSFCYSIVFVV